MSTNSPQTPDTTLATAQRRYPDRYYAEYDPHSPQPAPVLGWYDTWIYTTLDNVPPLSNLLPLSPEFWATHISTPQRPQAVLNGKIVDYTPPPPPPPPLKDQAQAAMQNVQQQASMVTAMGETFGPQMRDYVKKLRAIVEGADTASTELPTMPSDVTT